MAKIPKKTVRKLVTLPLEAAARVDAFRQKSGATSESDALKALIEGGLKAYDTEKDLYERCQAATTEGKAIGELITQVIGDHPLVEATRLDANALTVNLKRGESEQDARFAFYRGSKEWHAEVFIGRDKGWANAGFDSSGTVSMDDDIPF
jgi:hypothetical protein